MPSSLPAATPPSLRLSDASTPGPAACATMVHMECVAPGSCDGTGQGKITSRGISHGAPGAANDHTASAGAAIAPVSASPDPLPIPRRAEVVERGGEARTDSARRRLSSRRDSRTCTHTHTRTHTITIERAILGSSGLGSHPVPTVDDFPRRHSEPMILQTLRSARALSWVL